MRPLIAVISVLSVACQSGVDHADSSPLAAQDSAGIVVIDNATPAWRAEEAWTLSRSPRLTIGQEEGPLHYAFGRAHSPVRLSDGTIVVADMQTNMMHFYDSTGTWLKTAGRSGEGPGEFQQLYRLRKIAGDSLMALNPASLTSIFTPEGEYVRRFDLDPVPGRGNLWWLGALSDGSMVGYSLQREGTIMRQANDGVHEAFYDIPEKPEFYRDSLLYMLFTMEGQLIDSIGKMPGQFLGPNRVYAPNAAYAFVDDVFYHSPGDRIEIRAFRSTWKERQGGDSDSTAAHPLMRLEKIIRSSPPRDLALTDELKERYYELERDRYAQINARQGGGLDAASLNRHLAATQFPPTIPAHGNRLYADPLGNLWLQEYVLDPDAEQRWLVFDRDGRWLGSVATPARFVLNEVGTDYVLGIWRDSLDVQYVHMYGIQKARSRE